MGHDDDRESEKIFECQRLRYWAIILCWWISGVAAWATDYSGVVKDAHSGEPVGFAAVAVCGAGGEARGVMTDDNGAFTVKAERGETLIVSMMGYESDTVKVGGNRYLDIELKPRAEELREVVVTRKKYRNKGNPAVELIRKATSRREENQRQEADLTRTRHYEKTMFAINDITDGLKEKKMLKSVNFVFENTDTTIVKGKEALPIYLKENLHDIYQRKSDGAKKTITIGEQMVRVKGLQVDNDGVAEYLKYMYQDINVYENTITFLTNGFLSPLATGAPQFYRYYIQDTTTIDTTRCVRVFFASRNKADLMFTGNLYITLDGDYAVKRVDMSVDGRINVNFIRGVRVTQDYEKVAGRGWMMKRDYLLVDFYAGYDLPGVLGERLQVFENRELPRIEVADSLFEHLDEREREAVEKAMKAGQGKLTAELTGGMPQTREKSLHDGDSAFWRSERLEALSETQERTYDLMDSVQKVPMMRRAMRTADIIGRGYWDMEKVEIGPLYGFYGYNAVEGHRLRFGGRTTNYLTKRANFGAYVAYGTKDEQWKWYGKAALSMTKGSVFDFPARTVTLSYYHDTHVPGRSANVNENSVFSAVGRHENRKMYYDDCVTLSHLFEFKNHFSYDVGFKLFKVKPGGDLTFVTPANVDLGGLNMNEAFITLRYAPKEKFYQGRASRHTVPSKYPIFTAEYAIGNKAIGTDYDYHRLVVSAKKRFYIWVMGTADVRAEAGKVWGRTAYPALVTHQSNQSFLYLNAYNMMNYLEFVSSQYASVWVEYNAGGFFLNKIPAIRRLKWREVATVKALWGELEKSQNPMNHTDLPQLPVDEEGKVMTYSLEKKPYIEGSVGITNIWRLLRVDFVKRFTYLDNPAAPSWGIRIKFEFDF